MLLSTLQWTPLGFITFHLVANKNQKTGEKSGPIKIRVFFIFISMDVTLAGRKKFKFYEMLIFIQKLICFSFREFENATHIVNSGFLEVAEENNIIMVFPQALSSLPENEIGCWDTFGLGGPLYGKSVYFVKIVQFLNFLPNFYKNFKHSYTARTSSSSCEKHDGSNHGND